jgi:uncharacterized protein GlcG (DUF336 family)
MLPGHRRFCIATGAAAMIVGGLAVGTPSTVAQDATIAKTPSLSSSNLNTIVAQAVAQAGIEKSLFRPSATTRMHIAVVDRVGRVLAFKSMDDAWEGSKDIAIAKARTAAFFSSNANALTSRTVGVLSQAHFPGVTDLAGPLWGIGNSNQIGITGNSDRRNGLITFPGGLPLYKDNVLVGGIGVSGDGVDQDEAVAIKGATGFEAPPAIRVNTVLPSLPYTTATPAVASRP